MAFLVSSIGYVFLVALGPEEKWNAIRRLDAGHGSLFTNKWFVLTAASIVFALTILLLAVRRLRIEREKEASDKLFDEYAERHGLDSEERKVLAGITTEAVVKRRDAIFTMTAAFNRGAVKFLQEKFALSQSSVDRKKLNAIVDSIREKLGFRKKVRSFGVRRGRGKGLSSRQIPVGKKVSIALSSSPKASRTDAVVAKNDKLEFVVVPEIPVTGIPGKLWNVHYRFGTSTWEFNSLTIACSNEELVLNHSDNIRFTNRRKFLRVAVEKPALIARFPVIKRDFDAGRMGPQFVQGVVTQLSGPGLRIKTDLDISDGDRILVAFELEPGKVIQDIGEVRGYRDEEDGCSIGVELIGLNELAVDELVRATNNLAISCAIKESEAETETVLTGGQLDG